MNTLIGADELVAAARAHHERTTPVGPRPIDRIVESIGVDSEELKALGAVLQEQRDPERFASSRTAAWDAGFIDGFVIGVRAARISYGESDSAVGA